MMDFVNGEQEQGGFSSRDRFAWPIFACLRVSTIETTY